jgi:serine protease Do
MLGVVAAIGIVVLALVAAPSVHGRQNDGAESLDQAARELAILSGRGTAIGASIRDLDQSDKSTAGAGGGVVVDDVRPNSPADKAGLKRSDVIVEFDGERVRSARQFSRLVQETAPGRTVRASILRDGQKRDVQIVPSEARDSMGFDTERLRERFSDLGRLYDRQPPFAFDMGTDWGLDSRGRLGILVNELTPQLARYFGAREGVLVAAVTEGSAADTGGLKPGDVVTAVNSEPVRSRGDLVRLVGEIKDGSEATIGIVRDKQETTVTVKIESRRPARFGRPV